MPSSATTSKLQDAFDYYWSHDCPVFFLDSDGYDDYHQKDDDDTLQHILSLNEVMHNKLVPVLRSSFQPVRELEDYALDTFSRIVHGSNLIEKAGASLEITRTLCKSTCKTGRIAMNSQQSFYGVLKADLVNQNRSADDTEIEKCHHEVVQHFQALLFLLDKIVIDEVPFSEALILETHRILTYKVDSADENYEAYGGVYRATPVCAGFSNFTAPGNVAREMRAFVADLSADMLAAKQADQIDPYMLAAKYCHKFVNIHPFSDGNGRTCRLILNVLLFKSTGIFCVLGSNGQEVQDYLSVAVRASKAEQTWKDADEEESAFMKPPWGELACMVLRQTNQEMKNFLQKLEDNAGLE